MARLRMDDDKKKPKIGISLNKDLLDILNDYIEDINVNRSKYIEKLIEEDMKNRGYDIDITPKF